MCQISFMLQCCFLHSTYACVIRKVSACQFSFLMQCGCFWICYIVVGNVLLHVPKGKLACAIFPSWYSLFDGNVLVLEGKSLCNVIAINSLIIVLNEKIAGADIFLIVQCCWQYICSCAIRKYNMHLISFMVKCCCCQYSSACVKRKASKQYLLFRVHFFHQQCT